MRFFHVTPSLSFGDAVGNDIFALCKIAEDKGINSQIYARNLDSRLTSLEYVHGITDFPLVEPDDVLFFHLSTGDEINEWVKGVKCRKIMIYHNITPPDFFRDYDEVSMNFCATGLKQAEKLKDSFDAVFADSSFNKQDLIKMGYKGEIKVLPILIPFSDYDKTPSASITKKYSDAGYKNIIFVGRIAPNKCQQDVIAAFDAYQKRYNPKSRLFIIGSPSPESYQERLRNYTRKLKTKNVIFTGHTKFDEILAYYKISDLFLCQSEHEGFCVPLAEAMYIHKPIVAYDSTAIGETLGGGGFLLKEKNPLVTAGVMNRILTDESLKNTIIQNQDERLKDFRFEKIRDLFWSYMDEFLGKNWSD